jgi:cytochrome b pre-mRNA-processing protein 3
MSFLKSLFGNKAPNPNEAMRPLYLAVIAKGREPHWYEAGQVKDSLDGRFDMISSILSLVLLRMENMPDLGQQAAWLTEIFVDDMDAQMREAGIGDVIIAKDMGKVMGALGGRIGAFRGAFNNSAQLEDAVIRNIYGSDEVSAAAKAHVVGGLSDFWKKLQSCDAQALLAGQII